MKIIRDGISDRGNESGANNKCRTSHKSLYFLRPNERCHRANRLKYLWAFLRVRQFDVVFLLKEYDELERINGIQPQSISKQRLIVADIFWLDVLQIKDINNLFFQIKRQLFHAYKGLEWL